MVVKLFRIPVLHVILFESRVILDGSQTPMRDSIKSYKFESRVILDGSQTKHIIML